MNSRNIGSDAKRKATENGIQEARHKSTFEKPMMEFFRNE
jgi:hypothetical protein